MRQQWWWWWWFGFGKNDDDGGDVDVVYDDDDADKISVGVVFVGDNDLEEGCKRGLKLMERCFDLLAFIPW